jgi:hypothetical protein
VGRGAEPVFCLLRSALLFSILIISFSVKYPHIAPMMAMKIKPTIKATVIVVDVITTSPQASHYITMASNWLMPDFRAGAGRENEKNSRDSIGCCNRLHRLPQST